MCARRGNRLVENPPDPAIIVATDFRIFAISRCENSCAATAVHSRARAYNSGIIAWTADKLIKPALVNDPFLSRKRAPPRRNYYYRDESI